MTGATNSTGGRRRPGPAERRGADRLPAAARTLAWLAAATLVAAAPLSAQSGEGAERLSLPGDTAVHEVVGLRFGAWDVTGLERSPDVSYSTIPVMDAFYQRGLGARTDLQVGLGLWRRGQVSGAGTIAMWVAPVFAGVKYYPVGGPEGRLDPYLSVAGGPALGFEQRRSSGFGSLESGWTAAVGAGAEAGGGVELELGRNFGLTADVQYQWVRYLAGDMNGPDTYRGAVIGAGLTYRLNLR